MIRKTAFLVTGTVTGLVAVLSYNPPKLENAIAASGTASSANTSTTPTDNSSQSSPAQPAPATTSNKSSSKNSSGTLASNSNSQAQSQATSSTANQNSTEVAPAPTATQAEKQSTGTSGTFKGETSQTRWGPVQVQITVSNGKITDVSTLQYPNGDRRSMMISSQVIPWLQQEALQVQSANIAGIGGATYTSVGFRNSLASAIQKAGL
jgi:uncharacterized protein with FMN-binding domain